MGGKEGERWGRGVGDCTLSAVCWWNDRTAVCTRGSPWQPSARYSSSVSKGAPCTPHHKPSHNNVSDPSHGAGQETTHEHCHESLILYRNWLVHTIPYSR